MSELLKEIVKEQEEAVRRIEQSPCGLCENNIKRPYARLHTSDYKTIENVFFHISCYKIYLTWRKKWINMWAEIGWHAKIDLLILKSFGIPSDIL